MFTINAEIRQEKGTSSSRRLRIQNKFPGILYGVDKKILLLTLDHNIIFNLQKTIKFYKENLCLIIQDKRYEVKVQAVQRHSFKLKLLHIDFLHL